MKRQNLMFYYQKFQGMLTWLNQNLNQMHQKKILNMFDQTVFEAHQHHPELD